MMDKFRIPVIASLLAHGLALISVSLILPYHAREKEPAPLEIINFAADPITPAPRPKEEAAEEKTVKNSAPVRQEAKTERAEPARQVLPVAEKKAEPEGETVPSRPPAAAPASPHPESVPVKAASVQDEGAASKQIEAGEAKAPGDKPEKTTDEVSLFKAMVRKKIERARYYPKWARDRGLEGIVGVQFSILPDGGVGEVKVVRPCHCELFNRAACDAIKKAAPYLPRPKEIEGREMAMEVNIGFKLE